MTKRNTSIQINGKHYDVLTGTLLAHATTSLPGASKAKVKSIDGVVGGQNRPSVKLDATPSQPSVVKSAAKPQPTTKRTPAAHADGHRVKQSATLMRHAVTKPTSASLKRHTKVHTPTYHAVHLASVRHLAVKPKLSLHSINQQRADRADQVAISPRVSRFAQQVVMNIGQEVEAAAVTVNKAFVIPATSLPAGVYQPDIRRAPRQNRSNDIFEQALLRATSHEQPAPVISGKKSRRAARALRHRMVSFSAGAVAVLALVGFFGYQQESVQFKMATNQAGFSATLPDYKPSGFNIDDVSVNSGYVNVRYRNADLNSSFAVTQKPSSWDSETLLAQITSAPSTSAYNTYKTAGRTVYVYGRNQAAWVHNGILYQVLGNGALSTQEFVALATSM